MRIVSQDALLLPHNRPPTEFIEQVARVCYKSEKHITEGSADKLVNGLVKANHWAMLEHEYVYIMVSNATFDLMEMLEQRYNKYLNFGVRDDTVIISGSLRAWREWTDNVQEYITWLDELDISDESIYKNIINLLHSYNEMIFPYHYGDTPINEESARLLTRNKVEEMCKIYNEPCWILPHTIKFITSRAIANELVRHRTASFAQLSQRYVDYNKSGEIEVIEPMIPKDSSAYNDWNYAMLMAETQYFNLRKQGISSQIARGVLPNDCQTEIVVTATEEEWQHIFNLRLYGTTGAPHPQMKQLMEKAYPILYQESGGRIL